MSLGPAAGTLALPILLVLVAVAAAGVTSPPPSSAAAKSRDLEADGTHKVRKRYVAALARNGDLPFSVRREWHKKLHPAVSAHRGLQAALGAAPNPYGVPGKRYVSTLARAGHLPGKRDDDQQRLVNDSDAAKRGISTLAKNGQLPAPLTTGDNRSDDGANGDGPEGGDSAKRGGVAALARLGYLPPHKKTDWQFTDLQQEAMDPEKRHLGSLARNFLSPTTGKRNVGSLARGGGFSALRYLPNAPRSGKRSDDDLAEGNIENFMEYEVDENVSNAEEVVKRYIAALLRHGRLPVGASTATADIDMDAGDNMESLDEEKRHLGALRRLGKKAPFPMVGVSLESPLRNKRNAAFASDEYPLPVYQPADQHDQPTYDQVLQKLVLPGGEVPEKRFLGRIPQMGRSRGRAPTPLRRGRPRSRNI